MTNADKIHILEFMDIAKGAQLSKIARAAAMGIVVLTSGDKKEYILHLQCAFRFRTVREVLIANLDMFEPTRAMEEAPSFDWHTFDWDVQGFNRFDEWALLWKKDGREATVEAIEISDFGDLTIRFSGELILEVFTNNAWDECWRFFERRAGEHLVVTAQGIQD